MESSFGRDLGGVRVHSGADAASAASNLNARAFTSGRDGNREIFIHARKGAPGLDGTTVAAAAREAAR